jgi:hypothetical protein
MPSIMKAQKYLPASIIFIDFGFADPFSPQKIFPWRVSYRFHYAETSIFELLQIKCIYSRCLDNKLHKSYSDDSDERLSLKF